MVKANSILLGITNLSIHSLIWLTILFVLVTIFVTIYDGKYQKLNRREFPDTTINGDLQIDDNLTVNKTTTQRRFKY